MSKKKLFCIISILILCIIIFLFRSYTNKNYADEGWKYLYEGNLDKAIKQFNKAIQKNTDDLSTILGLGYSYYLKGLYEESLNYFNKAVSIIPEAEYYNALGWNYFHLNKYDEAIKQFKKSIGLNPNYNNPYIGNSYQGLGWSYFSRRKNDDDLNEAENYFKKALEINENDAWNHIGLGWIYSLTPKKNKLAVKEFEKAIEINPTLYDPYYGLGWVYVTENEYSLTIKNLNRALERVPENNRLKALVLDILTLVYIHNKDYESALDIINQVLQIDPTYPYIYFHLAEISLEKKEYPNVLENINKGLKLSKYNNTEDNYFFITLGKYYLIIGDYDKAIETYKESIKISEGNTKFFCLKHAGLGLAYYYKNEFELAKKQYEKISDVEVYCSTANELKEKLNTKKFS